MLIYLSGGITNVPDYLERFARAEKVLTERGMSVINPAKVNSMMPQGTSYDQYMKMSLCMLSMCDRIYMIDGWENSKGANKEREYARKHGIDIRRFIDEISTDN